MKVCVFEWRYGSEDLRKIFSLENWLKTLLRVEVAVVKAFEEVGVAPRGVAAEVERAASTITVEEWLERERQRGHDIAALAELLGEKCSREAARYVHLGLTSYDVVDTAWAILLRDALRVLLMRLKRVINALVNLSLKYANVFQVGRTHGQWASPITLGFKLANYVYELARRYEALCETVRRVVRAKIGGSVGTLAFWSRLWGVEKALKIREVVARQFGLEYHVITTQVAPRDGFAELAAQLAVLAGVLERFALEIRELSRPEISEVMEAPLGRVGSSAMPHKANPVVAERVCGLARVARGLVIPALENIALMHERDLTNSSSERIWIPHLMLTLDQMLLDTLEILERRLVVNIDAIRENLRRASKIAMSEALVALLVSKGLPRHTAHKIVMEASRRATEEGKPLAEVLLGFREVSTLVTREELEEYMKPENFVGAYRELISQAVEYAKKAVNACRL